MSVTYTGNPAVSDVAAVRFEIGDTDLAAPLLQDEEIAWAVLSETGVTASPDGVTLVDGPFFAAAARCCEVLAVNLSRQADTEVGSLKETYSKAAQNATKSAQALRAKASGFNAPYAGGQSISEKVGFRENEDAVQPKFRRGDFDSTYISRDLGLPPLG